jgi:hypothetical protein
MEKDCAECAKVQVQVLQDMEDEGSQDLRGTLEITKGLVDVLEDLQFYRRKGNCKEEEARRKSSLSERRSIQSTVGTTATKTRQLPHGRNRRSHMIGANMDSPSVSPARNTDSTTAWHYIRRVRRLQVRSVRDLEREAIPEWVFVTRAERGNKSRCANS